LFEDVSSPHSFAGDDVDFPFFYIADASETAKPKSQREKKEAFKIDFMSPAERDLKETAKELFAPVAKGASITLPGTSSTSASRKKGRSRKIKEKEKKDDHCLPDDMHFTSRQLVTLFLKPKFSVCFFLLPSRPLR
jgi:condensin complex subunit 2